MAVWNVGTLVVAPVEADTEKEALAKHADALRASGHEPHEEGHSAFESEPLGEEGE